MEKYRRRSSLFIIVAGSGLATLPKENTSLASFKDLAKILRISHYSFQIWEGLVP